MEAKLSVIVPVYNVEKYLRECIESILNQSMEEIEVILVDDGSTDCSGLICDEYAAKDQRVRVIHQENIGPALARRRGMQECHCKYITFVDGDDFIARTSFALAETPMENNVDIILFGVIRYYSPQDQRQEPQDLPKGLYFKGEIEQQIWPKMIWSSEKKTNGMFNALWNRVVKKSLLEFAYQTYTCGNIHYGDDVAIVLPLYKYAESVEIMEECYYFYRQRKRGEVPGYITDPKFFDKTYLLYCHLRKIFQDDNQFTKQLDYYYMKSVCLRKLMYGEIDNVRYLFPFDKVLKGERIVVYGAGVVGKSYMEQINRITYCKVVLWVDIEHENYSQLGVLPVETIKTVFYDKIVIAVENSGTREAIAKNLVQEGIDWECIVR